MVKFAINNLDKRLSKEPSPNILFIIAELSSVIFIDFIKEKLLIY